MPRRVPPVLPACAAEDTTEPPRIASPPRGVSYTLQLSKPDAVIPLEAGTAADARRPGALSPGVRRLTESI
jgi:hypothetical protein